MERTLKQKLGARIQELRKSKNYTQEMLAEKIGIDKPNLSNIECGKRFMTAETLEKIAKALNVEEQVLFDFGKTKSREDFVSFINEMLNKMSEKELKYFSKIIFEYMLLK